MPSISLNFIRVGADQFTTSDEAEIADALAYIRSTYSTVRISINRVEYYNISTADAWGSDVVHNAAQAELLTRKWSIPNHNIDVFLVKYMLFPPPDQNVRGLTPKPGPCVKNYFEMDGCVVKIEHAQGGLTGQILAHEVGHYLNLPDDRTDLSNLMYWSLPNGGTLDIYQGAIMRDHCFVEP